MSTTYHKESGHIRNGRKRPVYARKIYDLNDSESPETQCTKALRIIICRYYAGSTCSCCQQYIGSYHPKAHWISKKTSSSALFTPHVDPKLTQFDCRWCTVSVAFALDRQFGSRLCCTLPWKTCLLKLPALPLHTKLYFDFCAMTVFRTAAKVASGQQIPTTVPQLPVGIWCEAMLIVSRFATDVLLYI